MRELTPGRLRYLQKLSKLASDDNDRAYGAERSMLPYLEGHGLVAVNSVAWSTKARFVRITDAGRAALLEHELATTAKEST
jgi:hypothetical protein